MPGSLVTRTSRHRLLLLKSEDSRRRGNARPQGTREERRSQTGGRTRRGREEAIDQRKSKQSRGRSSCLVDRSRGAFFVFCVAIEDRISNASRRFRRFRPFGPFRLSRASIFLDVRGFPRSGRVETLAERPGAIVRYSRRNVELDLETRPRDFRRATPTKRPITRGSHVRNTTAALPRSNRNRTRIVFGFGDRANEFPRCIPWPCFAEENDLAALEVPR